MLAIRLLGPPEVLSGGKPVTLARRKSRAVLYYLAAHPQPVARRYLLGLIWPDHNPSTARHNLRTTLYNLRQTLGDHLQLNGELWRPNMTLVDAADDHWDRFDQGTEDPQVSFA